MMYNQTKLVACEMNKKLDSRQGNNSLRMAKFFFSQLRSDTQGQPYNHAGTREGKTNHNAVMEKGTNGNTMVDDRRTSILSRTETKLANEVIRKC